MNTLTKFFIKLRDENIYEINEYSFIKMYNDDTTTLEDIEKFLKTHKMRSIFMNKMLFNFAYTNKPELIELFCEYGAYPTEALFSWSMKHCSADCNCIIITNFFRNNE